ncbi:hypothetical protein Tco_0326311, partial [Tanacetum coccineum]
EELGVDVHEDSSCSDLINTFGAETSTDASKRHLGLNIIVAMFLQTSGSVSLEAHLLLCVLSVLLKIELNSS